MAMTSSQSLSRTRLNSYHTLLLAKVRKEQLKRELYQKAARMREEWRLQCRELLLKADHEIELAEFKAALNARIYPKTLDDLIPNAIDEFDPFSTGMTDVDLNSRTCYEDVDRYLHTMSRGDLKLRTCSDDFDRYLHTIPNADLKSCTPSDGADRFLDHTPKVDLESHMGSGEDDQCLDYVPDVDLKSDARLDEVDRCLDQLPSVEVKIESCADEVDQRLDNMPNGDSDSNECNEELNRYFVQMPTHDRKRYTCPDVAVTNAICTRNQHAESASSEVELFPLDERPETCWRFVTNTDLYVKVITLHPSHRFLYLLYYCRVGARGPTCVYLLLYIAIAVPRRRFICCGFYPTRITFTKVPSIGDPGYSQTVFVDRC